MPNILRYQILTGPRVVERRETIRFPRGLTELRRNIRAARDDANPRESILDAVRAYLSSSLFSTNPLVFPLAPELERFYWSVRGSGAISRQEVEQQVLEIFQTSSELLRDRTEFDRTRDVLFDGVLALRYLPREHPRSQSAYVRLVKAIDLIDRFGRTEVSDLEASGSEWLQRSVLLPEHLYPFPGPDVHFPTPHATSTPPTSTVNDETLRAAVARIDREIGRLRRSDLEFVEGEFRLRPGLASRLETVATEAELDLGLSFFEAPITAVLDAVRLETLTRGAAAALPMITTEVFSVGATPIAMNIAPFDMGDFQIEDQPVPTSAGGVRIAVATLYSIEEHLIRLEPYDVTLVQNVQAREKRLRETKRLHRTEEFFESETETTTETERDEQITEKNALHSEVSRTASEMSEFGIDIEIAARYGKTVEVVANTAYSTEDSEEESESRSVDFAREVVRRARERIVERQLQRSSLKTIEEFSERVEHGFDNTDSSEHSIGIYQELIKYHMIEVRKHEERTPYFDIKIPEPAALYLRGLARQQDASGKGLRKPPPFTLNIEDLGAGNYADWAAAYGAEVAEPPPHYHTIALTYEGKKQEPPKEDESDEEAVESANAQILTAQERVKIPSGYQALAAYVRPELVGDDAVIPTSGTPGGVAGADVMLRITVGRQTATDASQTLSLNNETGELPVTVIARAALGYTVAIEVLCLMTPQHLEKWRNDTYQEIKRAYEVAYDAYRNALAAAQAEASLTLEFQNPSANKEIIKTELRRSAISIITAQHFNLFGSVLESAGTLPQIDFDEAEAEGKYIAFFHRAIDWDKALWRFYDYYWARRQTWLDRMMMRHPDPDFQKFMQAGSMRALLPIKKGFLEAMAYFLETGEVLDDDEIEGVTSEPFLEIINSIKSELGADDSGEVIERFEISTPTNLAILNADNRLPAWELDNNGNWIPVA